MLQGLTLLLVAASKATDLLHHGGEQGAGRAGAEGVGAGDELPGSGGKSKREREGEMNECRRPGLPWPAQLGEPNLDWAVSRLRGPSLGFSERETLLRSSRRKEPLGFLLP